MTDAEIKELRDRMRDLGLKRDEPYAEPLAPDFHAELNAKLQPKPIVDYNSLADAAAVAAGIPRRMFDQKTDAEIIADIKTWSKYDQEQLEKLHGNNQEDEGDYYILGPV